MLITVLVAIPLGIAAARRRGGVADRVGQLLAQAGAAVPNFWIGLILIYVFFYLLDILPAPVGRIAESVPEPRRLTGLFTVDSLLTGDLRALGSSLAHLLLPAVTLSLVSIPATLQITRNTFIHILGSDYIRTARAFGLPSGLVFFKYALKNAVVPILTVLAMSFGFLMSGTVLIEAIFAWPGIGLYALDATNGFDYEPVIGVVLLAAVFYALAYLVADLISFAVDPRIRER
jgi:peptide/nickel transport system permease protein